MAEGYEVETVRQIADVDSSGELVDYWEVHFKTKPHGLVGTVRVKDEGGNVEGALGEVAAKAAAMEALRQA